MRLSRWLMFVGMATVSVYLCIVWQPFVMARAAHVHTAACYTGEKHLHTSSCESIVGYCSGHTTVFSETREESVYCGQFISHSGTYIVYDTPTGKSQCPDCSTVYDRAGNSTWYDEYCSVCDANVKHYHSATCPNCQNHIVSYNNTGTGYCTAVTCSNCWVSGMSGYHFKTVNVDYYRCNSCPYGYSSSYDSVCGFVRYGNTCGRTDGDYYDESGIRVEPICNRVVIGLTPKLPVQTVTAGQMLNAQATATFLDGTSKVVTCSYTGFRVTDYNAKQTVTLSYGSYHDSAKNSGAKSCTIAVTIVRIPVSLSAVADRNIVYNGKEPSYTVSVKYSDGASTVLSSALQYTKSGFTKGAGIKTVRFSYTESGMTVSTEISVTVLRNIRTCRYGHSYELSDSDTDEGCSVCATMLERISAYPSEQIVSSGDSPSFLVTGTYKDGHSEPIYGWTTNFKPDELGEQYVTITYRNLICQVLVKVVKTFTCDLCGSIYGANDDLSNPGCDKCRRTCVEITVSPAKQVVEQGNYMNLTVTARFLDGHEETVSDWMSNYRPYTLGKQSVMVVYAGQTALVEVEVVAKKEYCSNCGSAYDPMKGWCPNCGHILKGIRAGTVDGSNLVLAGVRPELRVHGIYLDGHEELIESGYSYTGLDIYTPGVQNVMVKYRGCSCTILITVLGGAEYTMCEKGHVYVLNTDDNNPSCPHCIIDAVDKAEKFYTMSYTEEILEQLYRDGVYYLNEGDAVSISITRQETNGIAMVFDWMFRRFRDAFTIKAGGIVRGKIRGVK